MATVRYYKGVHKVKILTKSEGYLIVEALEDFEDTVNNERIHVETGEKRIVPIENIYKQKTLPPMVREHAYELKMEKELRRFVAKKEAKDAKAKDI
jgi:hypothetical protein